MRYTTAGAFAACLVATSAFKNTSPFLLMSTTEFPSSLGVPSTRQLQSSKEILATTKSFLKTCPSDTYFIVSQPMVSTNDLSQPRAFPHLRREMSSDHIRTTLSVSKVVGEMKPKELQDYIISKCGGSAIFLDGSGRTHARDGDASGPVVARVELKSLPDTSADRAFQLAKNDVLIYNLFINGQGKKYTLLYTTTPMPQDSISNTPSYEATFTDPLHTELKRQAAFNSTVPKDGSRDTRPLFERYQFFTPGLFMGLLVSFLLLSILTVGLRALGSLQVSYGAFDKEMGPAAQKKQL